MFVAGVFVAIDHSGFIPTVTPPEAAQRHTKSEPAYTAPTPAEPAKPAKPSALASAKPKSIPTKQHALGVGIFKCEEQNGHITYSEFPCDGKLIDTKPTSGGFGDSWSISVKHR